MIIVCPKCSSRLQVDDTKVVSRPVAIRCPKCNSNIESLRSVPAAEHSATTIGDSPATDNPRFEPPKPAPLFELETAPDSGSSPAASTDKLVELLSGLAGQPGAILANPQSRPSWNPRKLLVCVTPEHREQVARGFAQNSFQVFLADDTRQAIDRMRENQLEVVLLDPRFDQVEQGAAFVTREVNILRPAQRRRLFFVLLSPTLRTMDAHAAFLSNVNAVVNVNEIDELPQLIEQRVRQFNELYKDFNHVLGMTAL